jgi:phosphoglycerol transferase MdoB-like AlkP superfamily enzyme
MRNYFLHVVLFLKRFVWLLVLYSVTRVFFYLLNIRHFSDLEIQQVFKSFIFGIRFDIAAIVFTNAVFLLWLLPGTYKNNRAFQKTGDLLFFCINAFALLGNVVDAKFFSFIDKRSTTSIFTLLSTNQDVWLMIPRFLLDYWYVALTWLLLMLVFWRRMPLLSHESLVSEPLTMKDAAFQILLFILLAGFMLLGARGTRLKPIGITDAATYTTFKAVPLVLNTPFSILKTAEHENLTPHQFLPEDSLKNFYHTVHQYNSNHAIPGKNVVIFILESFSKEYSGYLNGSRGYTPNLDSILKGSLVFTDAYANGKQSYEALPAIIAGMPSWMDRPYSGSNYATNTIESLPGLLGEMGYHTSFFHGGNNGTMGFDNFARLAGVTNYYGRNEYKNEMDFDGHWGIWDEPFLQYFSRRLQEFPQPFFSAVFTLSSHHPYNVPAKYSGHFREGAIPILKSIQYADFALGEFFKIARTMPWYQNTLFVFTADHAAQAVERIYSSSTGRYAIPIAFFCPSDTTLKGMDSTVAQQIDIMPTVLHYLGYSKPFFAFGESLLDPKGFHRAVTFVNGTYQLVEGNFVMLFDGKSVTSFYNRKEQDESNGVNSFEKLNDPAIRNVFSNMEIHIQAIIQTYNGCLLRNQTALRQNINTGAKSF